MATLEVSPTSGPEGTQFEFRVADAPVTVSPRKTCTVNIEGPGHTAVSARISQPNQTFKMDPTVGVTGETGQWVAKMYDTQEFFAWANGGPEPSILASAVFEVSA